VVVQDLLVGIVIDRVGWVADKYVGTLGRQALQTFEGVFVVDDVPLGGWGGGFNGCLACGGGGLLGWHLYLRGWFCGWSFYAVNSVKLRGIYMLKMKNHAKSIINPEEAAFKCLRNLADIKNNLLLAGHEYVHVTLIEGKPHTNALNRMEAAAKEYKVEYERCKDIITPKYG
jgi:hypothetical protein